MEAALPERQREGELRSCRGDGREGSGLGRSASNRKVLRDNIQGITNQARHPPWRRQAHLGGSFTRRPRGELKIFLENAILDGVTYTDHWLSLPWTGAWWAAQWSMVNGFELHDEAPKRRCGTGAAAQSSRAPTGKNSLTLSSPDDYPTQCLATSWPTRTWRMTYSSWVI
ncbi:hypothetical protein GW17_00007743 [Ensete ventricosum]|nr:hypothetical protein GW17_00007743 [Ensete ventricosum]RZR77059.1 hypothetical protein BHM03_00002035 [Ensete ventricosum]